jgi:sortase A
MEEGRYYLGKKDNVTIVTQKEAAVLPSHSDKQNLLVPLDEDFGIVIPKISANASVVADVDPSNASVYQRALTKGVAHAKGTAHPGEPGNTFIFAHSGLDFSEAMRYNAVFYLLNKLEIGDEIVIFYEGEKFNYKVSGKKIVNPGEIQYLEGDPNKKTLALMTCWPAGTTLKRLIIIGDEI